MVDDFLLRESLFSDNDDGDDGDNGGDDGDNGGDWEGENEAEE